MTHSASILVWLKRGVLIFCLLSVALIAVLYFWSVSILEAFLLPRLEARGGELELESIRINFSGAELRVERYVEKDLYVEGLSVTCPWSQLWSIRGGFAGSVRAEVVNIQISEDVSPEVDTESVKPEAQVAALAESLDALSLQAVDVVVDDLSIAVSDQLFRQKLEASLVQGGSGETHIAATFISESAEIEARVKVLAGGEGFALDFVVSAGSWDDFQRNHLEPLTDRWAEAGIELYVNSLGADRGFLDLSGYARWLATEPGKLSFTVLANLGAAEVYLPSGELILQSASAGLAGDGAGHLRAFGKGAIDSVRVGSWMESSGDWALRVDDARLAGELRIGETLSFSLGHDDWNQLLMGSGVGRFYLEAGAVDPELLRVIEVLELPDDLDLNMAVTVEVDGEFAEWKPITGEIVIDARVQEASVASKGVLVVDAVAGAKLSIENESLSSGALELNVERMDVLGFPLNGLNVNLATEEGGLFAIEPVAAKFMGGELRVEAMQIDSQTLEGFKFRVHLVALDLSQLASAVPQFEGEVSGQVSGYLVGALRDGLPVLTDGRLEIDPEQGARLSYDVDGLLTRGMPEDSAAYKQYRMAELAFQDLALKQFSIDVFPEGNTTRPFRLELFGESLQGETVVPVDFNLNVNVDDTAGLLELLRMIQRGELDLN